MLSLKSYLKGKTKVTLNPKLKDVMEKRVNVLSVITLLKWRV